MKKISENREIRPRLADSLKNRYPVQGDREGTVQEPLSFRFETQDWIEA